MHVPALLALIFRLGIRNVLRVIVYRASLRLRLHPTIYLKPNVEFTAENVFGQFEDLNVDRDENLAVDIEIAFRWFGWLELESSGPPNWHQSILKNSVALDAGQPWWRTKLPSNTDFDIKEIWEPSRFGWAIHLAKSAKLGSDVALVRLNEWTEDWVKKNPPFFGPNWICAQECSLRLIHVAAASSIIRRNREMSPALTDFTRNHLLRIASTSSYAKAQQNNHLVSEAVALFVGGTWLARNGHSDGHHFERLGRRLLDAEFPKLVYEDGEFSQHSANYQRLVNDLLCFVEVWRLAAGSSPFSPEFYSKAVAVNAFLATLLEDTSGRCPNMGGNDGAHILQICSSDYLDFHPSAEIGKAVFSAGGNTSTTTEYATRYFRWLGVANLKGAKANQSCPRERNAGRRVGGLEIVSVDSSKLYFRRPGYSFRPPNCDVLHVDFWRNGVNVLRDAGTFSYGRPPEELLYFHGSMGHNVVQFDNQDQMPLVSKFLFAHWPRSERNSLLSNLGLNEVGDAFRDFRGNFHARRVKLESRQLIITDQISGSFQYAVLRWRLANTAWTQTENVVSSDLGVISVASEGFPVTVSIVYGEEALYYGRKQTVPILEAVIESETKLVTTLGLLR